MARYLISFDDGWMDFPEEDLGKPGYPDEPESDPMANYIAGNTYEHDREHLGYIRGLLQEG